MEELLKSIQASYYELPKAKQKVARYFIENYHEIPFETAESTAKKIGVSGSTVVKYCMDLGLDGFGDFKKKVTEYINIQTPWSQKLEYKIESAKNSDIYERSLELDAANLNHTMQNPENRDALGKLIDEIDARKKIYVIGLRSSAILAQYLSNALGEQGYDTSIVTPGINDYRLNVMRMTKEDMLISFAFAAYAQDTVDIVGCAEKKGVYHFAFTDSKISPTACNADGCVICELSSYHNTPSLISGIALINAILAAIAQRHPGKAQQNLEQLESIFKRRDFYCYTEAGKNS